MGRADLSVDESLEALLVASSTGRPPQADELELLLTDGYAEVLRLDAERRELEEGMESPEVVEALERRLVTLRDRLEEARRRFGGSRQRHLDRRPFAGDGLNDQRPTQ